MMDVASTVQSNRNQHVHPPHRSALQQRSTFPYFSSTRSSTPFSISTPKTDNAGSQWLLFTRSYHTLSCCRRAYGAVQANGRRLNHSIPSIIGSGATVEGVVVPTNLSSDQAAPTATELELCPADIISESEAIADVE